jgi:hypothetical protein
VKCGGDDLIRQNLVTVVPDLDCEIDTSMPGNPHQDVANCCRSDRAVKTMRFTGETWQLFPAVDGHAPSGVAPPRWIALRLLARAATTVQAAWEGIR